MNRLSILMTVILLNPTDINLRALALLGMVQQAHLLKTSCRRATMLPKRVL